MTIFATGPETSGQGTVTNIKFYSHSLEMERNIQVYLPEGYNEQDAVTYPVVYFLHGADQNSASNPVLFTIFNNLIKNQMIMPCIIVKPDGNCPPWGRSYYSNSELYGNFEDYIVYDLTAYIDSAYNTISSREKRAIMGYSMGGYGAMKLALKHPDIFCGVAAHSGPLNMRMCSQYIPSVLSENGGAPVSGYKPDAGPWTYGAFAIAGALSPNLNHPPYYVDFPLDSMGNWIDSVWNRWSAENCPFLAAELTEADDLAIYFDCGEQDEVLSYAFNTSFADSLDQLGIPYEFQSFTGGHYNQLSTRFPIALQFLDSVMNPDEIEADTCVWTFKTAMPTGRGFTSGAVVDGKIYMIGGFPTHNSVTQANEMYNPATDTWVPMAGMPEGRCAHKTCAYGGKIYVFGGVSPDPYATAKDNVYVYDPLTDAWTQKADMPYENSGCGVAVVRDTIYLIGGMHSFNSPPISTVMAYHPLTDTWEEKAPMPTARGMLSACAVDGKIYAIGGTEAFLTSSYNLVEEYDPSTNTWAERTSMPTARVSVATCIMEGKIYAIGGFAYPNVFNISEMYDPVTDTWITKTPMQETRQAFFLGSVNDRIYAIGGSYPNPSNPAEPVILSSVEVYPESSEITGMNERRQNITMPGDISLSQNYPNPFYSNTTLTFSLQSHQKVNLRLYNLQGQQVAELLNEVKQPGDYTISFDSGDLAEGIYLMRLTAGESIQTIKCALLRQ
ncbi:MAG: alpha/beta hydrolase-fold protein [Bacteroidales bacterium]